MDKVVLSDQDTNDFVECSSKHVKTQGKLFKKQILRFGSFSHPKNPDYRIKVDQEMFQSLKKNFDNGVCPIVQFPEVDALNRHVENPSNNLGQVVDIDADEEGINAYIDVRKHSEDIGKTILGASANLALAYIDKRTGKNAGPTLLHVAATNRPYLVDLNDFETVSASDADTNEEVVLLLSDSGYNTNHIISEEEKNMTKDELIAALSEHGIDVVAGQQALADVQGYVSLSNVLGDDVVATPETLSNAMVELSNSIKDRDAQIEERETRIQDLTAQIQEASLSSSEAEVDGLIEKGRILPAWRDTMIQLSMSDREKFDTFVLPEELAKFELSEQGFTTSEKTLEETPEARAKAEGQRLANLAN